MVDSKGHVTWQMIHATRIKIMIRFGNTAMDQCNSNVTQIIIKDVGLRSMRVKYEEENSSLCQNCSDASLAMGLPTSSGFIKEG